MKNLLKKINLEKRLFIFSFLLVFVPVTIVGLVLIRQTKEVMSEQLIKEMGEESVTLANTIDRIYFDAQRSIDNGLNVTKSVLNIRTADLNSSEIIEISATNQITETTTDISIPTLELNGQAIANRYAEIDQVQEMIGGTATIFQVIPDGLLRISTNVLKEDDTRAVGTYIPTSSDVYKTVMSGDTYRGRAFVVTDWYLTAYEPIKDSSGDVIGAVYFGVKESNYLDEIFNALAERKIGDSGYIWIISTDGDYVLSLDRKRDGENILAAKDSSGREFIKEIVTAAPKLPANTYAVDYYPWKNKGESTARMKFASYAYIPEWEWVIAPSGYVDELEELANIGAIRNSLLLVGSISSLIGIVLAFLFAKTITQPINKTIVLLKDMAEGEGDLTQRLNENLSGEIGQLSKWFNTFINKLEYTIVSINENVMSVASAAQQLAASSQQASSASQQISSGIQQVASGAEDLAQKSVDAGQSSKLLSEESTKGTGYAQDAGEKMKSLAQAVNETASTVSALGSRSQEIVKIVDTINSIASQTNLLALNAAIEAARAGEAGRGFAVVAEEVRKLAEDSQTATKDIETLISEIKTSTDEAVQSMNTGQEQVSESTVVVEKAVSSLEAIASQVGSIEAAIGSVTSVAQQSASSTQQMSAGVQQTSSSIQQVAAAAQDMATAAEELRRLSASFKTSKSGGANTAVDYSSSQPTPDPAPSSSGNMISPEVLKKIQTTKVSEAKDNNKVFADTLNSAHKAGNLIEWNDDLSVHNETIDNQHKTLINKINQLHQAATSGKGADEVGEVLDFLVDYTVKHFSFEEDYFKKHNYPGREKHCAMHKDFVAQVGEMQQRFKNEGSSTALVVDLSKFASSWLYKHIAKTDHDYCTFIETGDCDIKD